MYMYMYVQCTYYFFVIFLIFQLVCECRDTLTEAIKVRKKYQEVMEVVSRNDHCMEQVDSDIEFFETDLKKVLMVRKEKSRTLYIKRVKHPLPPSLSLSPCHLIPFCLLSLFLSLLIPLSPSALLQLPAEVGPALQWSYSGGGVETRQTDLLSHSIGRG